MTSQMNPVFPNSERILKLYGSKQLESSKKRLLRKRVISIDTETTGLRVFDPKVRTTHVSWFDSEGHGNVIEANEVHKLAKLQNRVVDNNTTVLLFNAKFDIRTLSKVGIVIKCPIIDVLLVAQKTKPDENTKNLKHMVRKFLKDPFLEEITMKKWMKENPGKVQGHAPRHIVIPYAYADAKRALELFYYLMPGLDDYKLWTVLEREMLLMRHVMRMESNGVPINQSTVDKLYVDTTTELKLLREQLIAKTKKPGFNPNSHAQVAEVVYNGTVMPRRFSHKTGKPKVDEVSLLEEPSEIGSLVVRYRKMYKARSTYLDNLRDVYSDGRLRAGFNQGAARTGRFSSSGPNLQNIPRPDKTALGRIRSCFEAIKGTRLLFVDYKQIELRLTAHFSGEIHMLEAINKGHDLHDKTCRLMFHIKKRNPEWDTYRFVAKTLNFAVIYGTGGETFRLTVLRETDGKIRLSYYEAASYIENYKSKHPAIMSLFSLVTDEVAKTGGVVNHYGRYMPVDRQTPYVGVNYKIQGTAADFMKMKMILVSQWLKANNLQTKLIMTVHDELIFELYQSEKWIVPHIVKLMEDHTTFKVPLICSVSVGKNWQDKKELKI